MKNGLIENISMTEYQSDPAISGSDLVSIAQNGLARWRFEKTQPRVATRAMEIGSAVHALIQSHFAGGSPDIQVYSDGSFRTKGFEKWRDSLSFGAIGLDADEHALVQRCAEGATNDAEFRRYLKGALFEPSYFVNDSEFGGTRKCRPDAINLKEGVSINVKTTTDASESGFIRSIKDFGYDLQCSNYEDVLHLHYDRRFSEIHLLIEKSESGPVKLAIRAIDDDTLEQARFTTRRILNALKKAREEDRFLDPSPRLMTTLVPAWARSSAEWLEMGDA